MKYFIKADNYLLENEVRNGGYLEINNGRFGAFHDRIPKAESIVDWSGFTIAPGLFDTHIHGINGHDVMDGTVEAVAHISKTIVEYGVTRFLPTTLTASNWDLERAMAAVRKAVEKGLPGAKSEGIFLEGPYFTETHKGAQNSFYFRDPDYSEFLSWQSVADGTIVKIAIAPERDGSMDFIRRASENLVLASLAHTDASFNCSKQAIDAGASNFVHLFNGMSGLHHREPGAVGATLTDSRTFAELICDGHHVHPEVAAFAYRTKGNKLVLITDCMRAGLMPDGKYRLGEFPVVMQDGMARTEEGSLAGSTLTLIDGIRNLMSWSREPLYRIWHLATLSPAASLFREDELGSISKGKLADYVVLDQDISIQAVSVAGELKYSKN